MKTSRFISCTEKSLHTHTRRVNCSLPPTQTQLNSVQRGYFINALQRAKTHLSGAFSSPTVQPHRHISHDSRTGKTFSRDAPPQLIVPSLRPSTQIIKPPLRPKRWPTPILTQEDINTYLKPILYKSGWTVDYRRAKNEAGERYAVVSLQVYFKRLGWEGFRTLGRLVLDLQDTEKHHVEWKYRDEGIGMHFNALHLTGLEFPKVVALLLRTHSAILPPSPFPSFDEPSEKEKEKAEKRRLIQGITLRDVRFAMLLDELITQHNNTTTDPKLTIRKDLETMDEQPQPRTLTVLLSEPAKKQEPYRRRKKKKKKEAQDYYIENDWEELVRTVDSQDPA